MTVGDALALWFIGGTGLILVLCIIVELRDLLRDVLGYLRERHSSLAAHPQRGAENVAENIDPDEKLAVILAPLRRSTLHVVQGGDPGEAA